jgi:quercetin dioxygenase-like cupin family protein
MVTLVTPKHTFMFNNVTTQVYHANAGEGLPRHEHTVPHISFLSVGKIIIRKEGKELTMTPDSQPVFLKANEWHEIEALEDGTVFFNMI